MNSAKLEEIKDLDFFEDENGWVYNYGERVTKMYERVYLNGYKAVRVSRDKYRDIKRLERLYRRAKDKCEVVYEEWRKAFNEVIRLGRVIANCYHKDCSDCYHLYEGRNDYSFGTGVSPYLHYKFKDNIELLSLSDTLDIGNAYVDTMNKHSQYINYREKAKRVLNSAIIEFHVKPILESGRQPTSLVFNINSREYTYTKGENDRGDVDYGCLWEDFDRHYEEIS